MLPISQAIHHFENRLGLKTAMNDVLHLFTNFSSAILGYFSSSIYPLDSKSMKERQIVGIKSSYHNPFACHEEKLSPLFFRYVKPLEKAEYVDFGDGDIFYVSEGKELGSVCIYNLPKHEKFRVYKTIGIENFEDLKKIYPLELMKDFFDIDKLSNQLTDVTVEDQDKELYLAQLLVLHKEYRSLLFEALGLFVPRAILTSKTGEWQVRFAAEELPVKEVDFEQLSESELCQIVKDIQQYFILEKKYNLNLLGETPDFFDEKSVEDLFTISLGRAIIKENVDPLKFLKEDLKVRHRIFKDLMERNFPKSLTVKIFKKSEQEISVEENFQKKIDWIQSILALEEDRLSKLENLDPLILKILQSADILLAQGVDLRSIKRNKNISLESFNIYCWIKQKSNCLVDKLDFDQIYLSVQELLKDVPYKKENLEKVSLNYEKIVEKHFLDKSLLSSELYAFLMEMREAEIYRTNSSSCFDIYEQAEKLIKDLMNQLNIDQKNRAQIFMNDPWILPGDHFWKTFAEDFLAEIENYLMKLHEGDLNFFSLENQILMLHLSFQSGSKIVNQQIVKVLHQKLSFEQVFNLEV